MKQFNLTEERSYPQKIYASQLVTVDDLHQLQKRIVEELLSALKIPLQSANKKWLKSHEVRRLLKISPGTLQNLKNTGVLPFSKMGGIHFYDNEEIQRLLESGKMNSTR
ncbi:helix-turn-helix domain-containing protein [soil metagenome]|jgi:hypothetical protein